MAGLPLIFRFSVSVKNWKFTLVILLKKMFQNIVMIFTWKQLSPVNAYELLNKSHFFFREINWASNSIRAILQVHLKIKYLREIDVNFSVKWVTISIRHLQITGQKPKYLTILFIKRFISVKGNFMKFY